MAINSPPVGACVAGMEMGLGLGLISHSQRQMLAEGGGKKGGRMGWRVSQPLGHVSRGLWRHLQPCQPPLILISPHLWPGLCVLPHFQLVWGWVLVPIL